MAKQLSREEFLASKVGDLSGYTIEPRCPERNCPITYWHCEQIAREFGRELTVAEFIRRGRCRHCGGRVTRATMTDNLEHMPPYGAYPHTWALEIYP